MTTFRQLEALTAVVDMASFKGAARLLNTSQSAVSRLIQELEGEFAQPLFARAHKATQLTLEGQEVLRVARAILKQRSSVTERFCDPNLVSPTLRFGLTELAAITWVPEFTRRLRERYPRVNIVMEIGSSPVLHDRVRESKLDIALVVDVVRSTDMVRVPVGAAEAGWFCAPSLDLPDKIDLHELERQTLLIQGSTTGAGRRLMAWFQEHGMHPSSVIHSDSVMALSGIAAAGLGLANMPKAVALDAVRRGRLKEVRLPFAYPDLGFVALVKVDTASAFHRSVIQVAKDCCDFSEPFHLLD